MTLESKVNVKYDQIYLKLCYGSLREFVSHFWMEGVHIKHTACL